MVGAIRNYSRSEPVRNPQQWSFAFPVRMDEAYYSRSEPVRNPQHGGHPAAAGRDYSRSEPVRNLLVVDNAAYGGRTTLCIIADRNPSAIHNTQSTRLPQSKYYSRSEPVRNPQRACFDCALSSPIIADRNPSAIHNSTGSISTGTGIIADRNPSAIHNSGNQTPQSRRKVDIIADRNPSAIHNERHNGELYHKL